MTNLASTGRFKGSVRDSLISISRIRCVRMRPCHVPRGTARRYQCNLIGYSPVRMSDLMHELIGTTKLLPILPVVGFTDVARWIWHGSTGLIVAGIVLHLLFILVNAAYKDRKHSTMLIVHLVVRSSNRRLYCSDPSYTNNRSVGFVCLWGWDCRDDDWGTSLGCPRRRH